MHEGEWTLGARVEPALFAQLHERADVGDRPIARGAASAGLDRSRRCRRCGATSSITSARNPFDAALRRTAGPVPDPPDGARFADDAAARRADGQPRRRVGRRARGRSGPVRGHGARRDARPLVHAAARPVPVLRRGRHGAASCSSRRTAWPSGERRSRRLRGRDRARRRSQILGPFDLSCERASAGCSSGRTAAGRRRCCRSPARGASRRPAPWRVLGGELGRADVRRLRRRIGHVSHAVADRLRPQARAIDVVLTGKDVVLETWSQDLGPADRGGRWPLLTDMGCGDLALRPLAACSLGERQRILIARALFGDPSAPAVRRAGRRARSARPRTAPGGDVVDRRTTRPADDLLATHHLEEIPATVTHGALLRGAGSSRRVRSTTWWSASGSPRASACRSWWAVPMAGGPPGPGAESATRSPVLADRERELFPVVVACGGARSASAC